MTTYAKLETLESKGFVLLRDYDGSAVSSEEWTTLDYMDWKSGGDTEFAPIASANGEMECGGFWVHGKPDKDALWTKNAARCPTLVKWIKDIGARFGRARLIKLNCNIKSDAVRNLHVDDNNRLNRAGEGWVVRAWLQLTDDPNSYMLLRTNKRDASTESRINLPRNRQFVVDSERLYHATWHPGPRPRYALVVSFESGAALDRWINSQLPQ